MTRYIIMLSCSACSTGTDFEKFSDEEAIRTFDEMIAEYNRKKPFIVAADLMNTDTGQIIRRFPSETIR